MSVSYNHEVIEKKWQKVWDDNKAFAATDDYSKPKYYALSRVPISIRTGTSCWPSKTIYSIRYSSKKEKNAGI